MDYLAAILLGVLQGVSEFLPISSSGHLVIAEALLGGSLGENDLLIVALHVGTLLSILVVYRRDVPVVLRNGPLMLAIVVATLPIVVVGLTFKDAVAQSLERPLVAGIGLCLTAGMMALTRRIEHAARSIEQITPREALIVGMFQAVAVLPGISRSGSTIFGGLAGGLERRAAANFSFYIAVPAILGAAVLHMKDLWEGTASGGISPGPLLAGTLTAFAVGYLSLKLLLGIVAAGRLAWFAWYCGAVGVATIAWQLN